jgi:transcriptional regulator with XRE-family HTH domain
MAQQWHNQTTGERIRFLRGSLTQQALAEAAGVSVHLVQKAEQGKNVSLPYLMKLAEALGRDLSVVLGEQSPSRAAVREETAALRAISVATHEAGAGRVSDVEPGDLADLRRAFTRVWHDYWTGAYGSLGLMLPSILRESAATYQGTTGNTKKQAAALLADAMQLSGHFANNFGARDLAYAAMGYASAPVRDCSDELRAGRLDAVLSWIYLRDGKPDKAMSVAGAAAVRIEPRFSTANENQLAVYGNLMTNAAVAASRGGGTPDEARDYISQAHAVAARMTSEVAPFGAIFGPGAAISQSVSVSLALGDYGQALALIDGPASSIGEMLPSSQARYYLDVALARAEHRRWPEASGAVQHAYELAPSFTRTQALTAELLRRIGDASSASVRRLAERIGIPYAG